MSYPHILAFDPYAGGHHGQYVQMLLQHWVERDNGGRLTLVLPPDFPSVFPNVVNYASTHAGSGIHLSSLTATADSSLPSAFDLVRQDLANGRMVAEAIRIHKPDHCLLMYFDHVQLSLWKGLRFDFPVSISGIYFRPSFHYASLGSPPSSIRERVDRVRKHHVLAGALRNPHLATIFSLDPFAVPYVNDLAGRDVAVALPDGVSITDGPDESFEGPVNEKGSGGRLTALLFGTLDARKGVVPVLRSLELLSCELQERLHLSLVGRVSPDERGRIHSAVERARTSTRVEISLDDAFVTTAEVDVHMVHADFVLLAYQRHVGSSGVLVRAAAARRPVLGSDFGLVGAQIRHHMLGLAVDTTSIAEIARALETFLKCPETIPFNAESARRFALANTADAFAATIFSHLKAAGIDGSRRHST